MCVWAAVRLVELNTKTSHTLALLILVDLELPANASLAESVMHLS